MNPPQTPLEAAYERVIHAFTAWVRRRMNAARPVTFDELSTVASQMGILEAFRDPEGLQTLAVEIEGRDLVGPVRRPHDEIVDLTKGALARDGRRAAVMTAYAAMGAPDDDLSEAKELVRTLLEQGATVGGAE
jgi:hypothetical protein